MATDGKIYIIVTDKLPGGSGPIEPDKPKDADSKKSDPLGDFAKHQFFNLIERQAKQAINYTISNIGNFTGDYIKQSQIQGAMELAGFAMSVAGAAMAGFKYTGSPYGAAVGAIIAVASKAITVGEQTFAGYVENARQNRAISQLRTRAGLNAINNGSRGTEY